MAGAAALAGSLALGRPASFGVTTPAGLLIIVVAAGAIAADAIPLRRVPLACSTATLVLGVALVSGRAGVQAPAAAAIVALQAVALGASRRRDAVVG